MCALRRCGGADKRTASRHRFVEAHDVRNWLMCHDDELAGWLVQAFWLKTGRARIFSFYNRLETAKLDDALTCCAEPGKRL